MWSKCYPPNLPNVPRFWNTGSSKSWTAKLLGNPELLRKKIREEAGELCDTQEHNEGQERTASEFADLLYHSLVLANSQVCPRPIQALHFSAQRAFGCHPQSYLFCLHGLILLF